MPMLIVSNDAFELEKQRLGLKQYQPKPVALPLDKAVEAIIEPIERGRGEREAIPEQVREFLATEALLGAKAKDLSEEFDVSQSSISAYKVGAHSTSTYNEPNKELKSHLNSFRKAVAKKAEGRLIQALESLTDAKIEAAKAKDIALIAKSMSAVVRDMEVNEREDSPDNKVPQVQFVFFAPKIKSEEFFGEVLEVQE